MIDCHNQDSALNKIVKVSLSVVSEPTLLEEIIQEIEDKSSGPICSMFKALFKKNILTEFGMLNDFLACFFATKRISEITIYDASNLGVKCFFMPKNTMFPLHDHPNKVICTGVLYGKLKYLSLNKEEGGWYEMGKKGMAKVSDVLFSTQEIRNIHSLLAIEDSIILDIFMPNYADDDDSNSFKIIKKRKRSFKLEKYTVPKHKAN
ncbi:hypothetical protein SteCoe_10837 [Stentor coeruleus]|uniref:Cysteine dioxygenase n=1 Tax=Stentor coeruleus TaxID=5963 RepID=A0A1R2CEP7_9CILI|nr:hypothetical protein SteCoe_10837 [Stentor coeruleus]